MPLHGSDQPGRLEVEDCGTRPGVAGVDETEGDKGLTTTSVGGENCLSVSLVVTVTGRESAPVTQCVTVP